MDVEAALSFLTEISSQIGAAVVFDEKGNVTGSTFGDRPEAGQLASRASELLEEAARLRGAEAVPTQLEVATADGSVFVVRDGTLRIVATTGSRPTTGLVFYDLKSALREIEQKPRRPRRRKPTETKEVTEPAAAKAPSRPRKKPAPRKKPDAS